MTRLLGGGLHSVCQAPADRLGCGNMGRNAAAKKRALALASGPVKVLFWHGHIAGLDVQRQTSDGGES